MKIEFHLNKFDRKLQFQIVNMDLGDLGEDITYPNCLKRDKFLSENGKPNKEIIICSRNRPDIDSTEDKLIIWLRGEDKNADMNIVIKNYHSNESRDRVYDEIIEAFKMIKTGELKSSNIYTDE